MGGWGERKYSKVSLAAALTGRHYFMYIIRHNS